MEESINKTTIFNIISVAIVQGFAFITTPVFSRMMGTSQYGRYSILISWVIIFTCFLDLGLSTTIGLGKYKFKDEYYVFKSSVLLYSIIIGLGLTSLICLICVVVSSNRIYSFLVALLICGMSMSRILYNFIQSSNVYEKKAKENLIISLFLSFFVSSLSLFVVYKFNCKYIWKLLGEYIPYFIVILICCVIILRKQKPIFKREYLLFGVSVGSPIIFHELARSVLTQSDRVMMERMNISDSDIGVYSLFYAMCSALNFVLIALNNSWCPFYYDDLEKNNIDSINNKTQNYIELFTVLAIGFVLISREIGYVMGDKSFYSGINIVPILVLSIYFIFMYLFPVNFEIYHKKTVIVSIGSILAAIINIILNYYLIPEFNYFGAAIATMLSYFMLFCFHFFCANFVIKKKYNIQLRSFVISGSLLIVFCILFYVLKDFIILRWIIGLSLGIFESYRLYKRNSIF